MMPNRVTTFGPSPFSTGHAVVMAGTRKEIRTRPQLARIRMPAMAVQQHKAQFGGESAQPHVAELVERALLVAVTAMHGSNTLCQECRSTDLRLGIRPEVSGPHKPQRR